MFRFGWVLRTRRLLWCCLVLRSALVTEPQHRLEYQSKAVIHMSAALQVIRSEFTVLWRFSLFSFVIAGLTGFIYRYGFIMPLPGWLHLDNIRHAIPT